MPLSRLLAIALLVFPLLAGAQTKPNQTTPTASDEASSTAPADPLQVLPPDGAKGVASQDATSETQAVELRTKAQLLEFLAENQKAAGTQQNGRNFVINPFTATSDGQILAGVTCLKMRSYVVARDSKDSESTHLVRYSTCQPVSRYRVKTVELQVQPPSQ